MRKILNNYRKIVGIFQFADSNAVFSNLIVRRNLQMRNLLFGLLIFIIACTSTAEEPIKFGAVLPLSGSNAFYGTYSKVGMELAVEDINANGGINGRLVKIIFEDSAGDKAKATTAAQKLVQVDNVDALFTTTTSMAGAIAPIAEENKIPFIYASTANSIAEGKTYVFKDNPNAVDLCKILMKEAVKKHQKIALFGVQLEATELCKKGAEEIAQLIIFEQYTFGETDYKTQLAKIKESGSTALLVIAFSNDCNNVYKQIRETGLSVQLLVPTTAFGCGSPDHLRENPDLFVNAYGSELDFDEDSKEVQEFKQRIDKAGGTTQILGSAISYDSVTEMAQAYERCKDTLCVTNNLRMLNYKGLSGMISYNGKQAVTRTIHLQKYENGKWVKV